MRQKIVASALASILLLAGCSSAGDAGRQAAERVPEDTVIDDVVKPAPGDELEPPAASSGDPVTILIAAAASLEYSCTQRLIPLFQEQYPTITVEGTYDSSGKLQTQIEEGLGADVFLSAATKQMDSLKESGMIDRASVVDLLENRIVLIAPADSDIDITEFSHIVKAGAVALGDPGSVPVGQYSEEALGSLGIYDEVAAKTSFGTNATQVLNWVAEGSADVGIVYATDAATTDKVKVLVEIPADCLSDKVIYPVGILSASEHREAADLFVDFLQSSEALAIFAEYGFTPNV